MYFHSVFVQVNLLTHFNNNEFHLQITGVLHSQSMCATTV
jgi:hypothetical protein